MFVFNVYKRVQTELANNQQFSNILTSNSNFSSLFCINKKQLMPKAFGLVHGVGQQSRSTKTTMGRLQEIHCSAIRRKIKQPTTLSPVAWMIW